MKNDYLKAVGERIDQLISLDVASRNAISILYPLAREKQNKPLCMMAALMLTECIKPGDVVFITTGWPDRPHISAEIGESDGPPGAAALARALHRGLGAIPFIFIEEQFVTGMAEVLKAAGFKVLPPEQAIKCHKSHAPIHGAAVLPFPTDMKIAEKRANELISNYLPSAVISIEKGGMNEYGKIHTSRGADTTETMAKSDYLMIEAKAKNIVTIGIGDGGNEIGMGVIKEDIKKNIKYGDKCLCGCGGGIAPSTITDVLVAAAISNWGAYGIAACLAAILRNIDVLHGPEVEERILKATSNASFIDGITGYVEPSADGLDYTVHKAFIVLLNEIVKRAVQAFDV